jgi:hypothetical protein
VGCSTDLFTEELECLVFGPDETACCPVEFGDELVEFEGVVD